MIRPLPRPASSPAFSLVEVTVAIGIFAFVAVAILGLLPAAMKLRADSSQETLATMIAQQLIASVDAAPSLSSVTLQTGAYQGNPPTATTNLLTTTPVLGYLSGTSLPFWIYNENAAASWVNSGASDSEVVKSAANNIATMARLSVVTNGVPTGLARVTVEVRAPASLALSNSRVVTFTTLRPVK